MAATEVSSPAPRWLDDAAAVGEALAAWKGQRLVGVDTEFVRERTYWPKLALVQLSVPGEILLVDPLAEGVPEALAPLLADPGVLKLMHSVSEDLQALRRGCNVLPEPLFDTQLAAAMTAVGSGLGYQKLVSQVTGVALEKGETRSDWLQRPLSERQREYAADDVRHLHALHAELAPRLQALGRSEWLEADCQRAVDAARHERPDPWPHLAVRSSQMLDPEAQARLCRLLKWRDEQARHSDRPRSWILDNELAVVLARGTITSRADFERLLDRHPRAPRQLREPLWEQVTAPLSAAELEIPAAAAQDELDRAALKRLQARVAEVSRDLGLPDGLLASRRHLETLLASGRWPKALAGWREPLLRPVLARELEIGD